jgi:hypothetical protein
MVRAFAALSALVVLVAVLGCGHEPGANNPAGPAQPAAPVVNNTPQPAEDSFRLALEDTRSNESTKKRLFLLTVPSSAKVITVIQGQGQGTGWQLPMDPSTDAERQCTFEISQSISEQKEPEARTVTGRCSLPARRTADRWGYAARRTRCKPTSLHTMQRKLLHIGPCASCWLRKSTGRFLMRSRRSGMAIPFGS